MKIFFIRNYIEFYPAAKAESWEMDGLFERNREHAQRLLGEKGWARETVRGPRQMPRVSDSTTFELIIEYDPIVFTRPIIQLKGDLR